MAENYLIRTVAEEPALANRIQALIDEVWPAFVTQGRTPKGHPFVIDWFGIYRRWPQYQIAVIDPTTNVLVAAINALTFAWDGDEHNLPDTGWDWVMHQARLDFEAGAMSKIVCALGATVKPDVRGQNLSRTLLELVKEQAKQDGYRRVIVPVRPNLKSRYPITPIDEYIAWTNEEGLPFDPWLRVHIRLGGRIVKACPQSTTLGGSVAEWEQWTGMKFPGSGQYTVPEMLAPLHVDREADQGIYVEPNVWVMHEV
jgi:hypothetical protein